MSESPGVDIYVCIHFRGFIKMGNFARIRIHILCVTALYGIIRVIFEGT